MGVAIIVLYSFIGTLSVDGSHVSFSIEPNDSVIIERNSPAQIVWQIQDTRCQPNGWRAEVGVRSETLLLYPRATQSVPNENYSNYNVTAVRGECEEGMIQKVNITFTVFVGENDIVNFTEYIFCEISTPLNANSIRSVVHLLLASSSTTAPAEITTTAVSDSSSITPDISVVNVANEILSTSSSGSQSYGQSANCYNKRLLLVIYTVLILLLLSIE